MFKKAISLVIVLTLCICLTPVKAIIPGEDAYTPNADYCELVSEQDIIEGGYIERLHEEETEQNTAVYRNADGTNTMYIFSQDVWYRDSNGVKQNYTSEIVESNTQGISYESVQGTKCLTLSTKASNGIRYSENGYAVTMFPSNDRVISGVVMSADTDAEIENTEPIITEEVEETVLVTESIEVEEPNTVTELTDVEVVTESTDTEETAPVDDIITDIPSTEINEVETIEPVAESTEAYENVSVGIDALDAPLPEAEDEELLVEEELTDIEVIENNTPLSIMEENIIEEEEENLLTFLAPLFEGNAQLKTIDNPENGLTKSAVTYGNTFSNIDYTVVPVLHGFQNQMSVRNANTDNKFSFRVYLENVIPGNSQGDNIPLFNVQGKMVMQINAETLCDSNGVFIPGSTIDIAPYGNGYYLVTVTLSEEVLEREDLVYPLITTMATTTIGDDPIYDTCVCSATPSTNYGSSANLTVGRASASSIWSTYIQYHLSSYLATIKPNSITDASLYFYKNSGISTTVTPYISGVSGWSPSTLTYNSTSGYAYSQTRNGVSMPSGINISASGRYHLFSTPEFISACIREHLDPNLYRTLAQSRGMVLTAASSSSNVQYFNSANASSNKPYVVVYYHANYNASSMTYYDCSDSRNCLGYVLRLNSDIQPNMINPNNNSVIVSTPAGYFNSALYDYITEELSIECDPSVGRTEVLEDGYYKIAMRCKALPGYSGVPCYHFWAETTNGKWAHKPDGGSSARYVISTDNPDDDDVEEWTYTQNYYTYNYGPEVYYFAIKN